MSSGRIIDIKGKIPNDKEILLQSAPDTKLLKQSLNAYLVRSLEEADDFSIQTIQKLLKTRADKVKELSLYKFEPNQRVDELIGILMIARTINQMKGMHFVPAWQRPKQGDLMKSFTGKESWDGFIYENVPLGAESPFLEVKTIPIEVKSLMINPYKDKFDNLIDLLEKKMPKFGKHFKAEGTICAVMILPYSTNINNTSLSFDLKEATDIVNKHVIYEAIGCLLFLDLKKSDDGSIHISVKCHIVNKHPVLGENGSIDNVALYEMTFGKTNKS